MVERGESVLVVGVAWDHAVPSIASVTAANLRVIELFELKKLPSAEERHKTRRSQVWRLLVDVEALRTCSPAQSKQILYLSDFGT